MKPGLYTFNVASIPPESIGLRATFTKLKDWPKGPCIRFGLDESMPDALDGAEWVDRAGKATDAAFTAWEWPGEALKDAQGRTLCVPLRAGKLVVEDTVEAKAESYPLTVAQIKAAPDGIHAFIRKEIRPAAATLFVEVLQEIEADVVFEAL